MKLVSSTAAIVFAVFSFLSVSAQNMGDDHAIADNEAYNRNVFFADSELVANYINLSKIYLDKSPDSSLYFADLALKYAVKTKDSQILGKSIQQRKFVQDYSLEKLKKQNDNFYQQNTSQSTNTTPLVVAAILILITCIFLSILYIRKNNSLKRYEVYNEILEQRNKELISFNKETADKEASDKNIEQEIAKEVSEKNETDLIKIDNIKDRLIPMIAHDIRSPLASVQHMLSLARENILNPEEFQKLSFSLEADIYNMRGMLDNMLLWTREQMVEIKVTKTLFNISEAIKDVILMHRNSLITKNITINNYLLPEIEVFADKEITTAVLRNIFSNAVKFTPQGKSIYVTQIYLNKKIFISIKDEGKGMSEEIIEKIQGNEHISTRGTANEKSTGIGIMFTKDLLKKMDEAFDITSLPGYGTSVTFSVSMPHEQVQLQHKTA